MRTMTWGFRLGAALLIAVGALTGPGVAADKVDVPPVAFPFKDGDRVAWIGSSSTNIGVWPKTLEFQLRTRHPDVKLEFKKFSTGGGTFATGLQNMDKWLDDFKPTVVFFNYGGNDAGGGDKGLPVFKENMEKCVDKVKGIRFVMLPPQAADVRKSGEAPAARRALYARTMLEFAKEKKWPIVDIHHPLEALQQGGEKDDPAYTILKDSIHLTDPAYIAWGYFLYQGLNAPKAENLVALSATGKVEATVKCKMSDVRAEKDSLSFTRADEFLPLLPPGTLPPRNFVPLESLSRYMLKVTELPEGKYAVRCEGKPIGIVDAKALADGVNLNSVLLDGKNPAPWEAVVKELWAGKALDQIGKTQWRFEVRKQ
ncbi:MAG: hypothetical protein K2R98_00005 [Gemmataceae bacterium]|nr:hypothetical protein [Gemmataceae bacterium]